MLVTVTFDITTKDQKTVIEEGLYVDIEVTEEALKAILDQAYSEGFRDGKDDVFKSPVYPTFPGPTYPWYDPQNPPIIYCSGSTKGDK